MSENNKCKVFISYRRKDNLLKDTVFSILNEYIDENRIFVDKKDLYKEPNKWFETIKASLLSSEYIIICLDKDSYNKEIGNDKTDWYYEEIDLALERQKQENKINIILAVNNRPSFDKTKRRDKELSELQDVCYNSGDQKIFKDNLLRMVGIDVNTSQKKSTAETATKNIINNVIGNQYNFGNINGGTFNFN